MQLVTKDDISSIIIDDNGFTEQDKKVLDESLSKGFKPFYVSIDLPSKLTTEEVIKFISQVYALLFKYNKHECSYNLANFNDPNLIKKLREQTGYFYSFEEDTKGRYVSKDEYNNAEEIITTYVNMIKLAGLTPLETIFYASYIIGGYEYKENNSNKWKARFIATIINNEQIVCVGYSILFVEVLRRLGIKSTGLGCSYKKESPKDYKYSDHETPVVLVNDDTYNIHDALYIVDIVNLARHMNCIKSLMKIEEPNDRIERDMDLEYNLLIESTLLTTNQKENDIKLFGINQEPTNIFTMDDTSDNIKGLIKLISNANREEIIKKFNNAPIINWELSKTIWDNLESKIGYKFFDISGLCEQKRHR